jgi:hypothetical protein
MRNRKSTAKEDMTVRRLLVDQELRRSSAPRGTMLASPNHRHIREGRRSPT